MRRGDKRLRNRHETKQLFLDAMGESSGSDRRNRARGIEYRYTLNKDHPGKLLTVLLLDEHFYRDPLPCSNRIPYCKKVLERFPADPTCNYVMKDPSACCDKDASFHGEGGWCHKHKDHPQYANNCDSKSPSYAATRVQVQVHYATRHESGAATTGASSLPLLDTPLCEVLGLEQRYAHE
eukprot:GHVU01216901.1.p1 GENE.GHVU01216901.1~~GHVU01216901.1.p1  ORF type:complete len:180 (-),score=32.41 GHVU01216901.1:44-583(-)